MQQLRQSKFLAAFLVFVIAVVDYSIPLGVSVGILYVIPLLVLIHEKTIFIVLFAFMITIFILINLSVFALPTTPGFIIANRFLSVFSIWIIVCILFRYKGLKAKKEAIKERQKQSLEKMLFITNHKVRHPIATLIAISEILNNSQFNEEERNEVVRLMQKPIVDLNNFTEELTDFMALQKNNF
jgi:cytochrome c biogenesis factor